MTDEVYPYPKDPHQHEHAYIFFNAAGLGLNFDDSNTLAGHVFDELGCGPPGTMHEPKIKYDALGSDGGPWKPGEWIRMEQDRRQVGVTAPAVPIDAMTPEQRAELKAALLAAEVAEAAGALSKKSRQGDE